MAAPVSIDELIEALGTLVRDGEALLETFARNVGSGPHEPGEQAQHSIGEAMERLAQGQKQLLSEATTALDVCRTYLRRHPWKSLAMAAGTGILIGALLSRHRNAKWEESIDERAESHSA